MTIQERIKNRKIAILGMARSGIAAAKLAVHYGGQLFVSDSASADSLKEQTDQLFKMNISFETDGHTEKILNSDYIIVSPGVPLTVDIIKQANEKGVPIFSELEFASWICPGAIVAVTGSNGKTTTTTLIGEMFRAAGLDTYVCGNIGNPLAEVVLKMKSNSIAIVEVSSFQLETIEDFKPKVATILNLTPDHLDRHGDFEKYCLAKYRITENQTDHDILILNQMDKQTIASPPVTNATTLYFSAEDNDDSTVWTENEILCAVIDGVKTEITDTKDITIPGPHNLQNAAAAVAVALQFDIGKETIASVLRSFNGVEHRLEQVDMVAGIIFVNDSKATNVDSVCYALRSINTPVYLICGGKDKGASYKPIIESGTGTIKQILAIGEASQKIFDELGKSFPTDIVGSLDEAVIRSFGLAHPGETILLSPGCSSFDMFDNYEHRGREFKRVVMKLKKEKNRDETVTG